MGIGARPKVLDPAKPTLTTPPATGCEDLAKSLMSSQLARSITLATVDATEAERTSNSSTVTWRASTSPKPLRCPLVIRMHRGGLMVLKSLVPGLVKTS